MPDSGAQVWAGVSLPLLYAPSRAMRCPWGNRKSYGRRNSGVRVCREAIGSARRPWKAEQRQRVSTARRLCHYDFVYTTCAWDLTFLTVDQTKVPVGAQSSLTTGQPWKVPWLE